jgi:two-component system chemotaxis sensor kinase CheA
VPCLRLRDVLHFTSAPPDVERVVVLEIENQRTGLVIDRVLGNHQTVLKSLGWIGRRTPVFSGATVLGDGRIALILDVPALLTHQRHRNGSKPAPGI